MNSFTSNGSRRRKLSGEEISIALTEKFGYLYTPKYAGEAALHFKLHYPGGFHEGEVQFGSRIFRAVGR